MKKNLFFLAFLLVLPLFECCTQEDLLDNATVQLTESDASIAEDSSIELNVTQAQALSVANLFLGRNTAPTRTENVQAFVKDIDEDGTTLIYIINYKEGGFVLVSAKTTYYPILAYSDSGQFEYNSKDMHPELQEWLKYCKKSIKGEFELSEEAKNATLAQWSSFLTCSPTIAPMRSTSSTNTAQYAFMQRRHELGALGYNSVPLSNASSIASHYGVSIAEFEEKADTYHSPRQFTIFAYKANTYDSGVPQMLTTKWEQGYPYNALSKENKDIGAGCATIAMAQIMKYYKHPSSYNWSNMPDTTATQDTQKLIRDIASGLGISYSDSDNGATYVDAMNVFTSNAFQYNATKQGHNLNDVINKLSKGPVFMIGFDSKSADGHAWVCDGYKSTHSTMKYFVEYLYGSEGNYEYKSPDTPSINGLGTGDMDGCDYFHMNWGWGGLSDGWYLENNVSTFKGDFSSSRININVSPK